MKNNNNNEDVNYWKLQYEQLRKQKKLFYSNGTNQQLVQQLQEKCQKQELTIEKLNKLIRSESPVKSSIMDDADIVKLQFKQQLEEKDSLIVSLQRDNLNIQKVALEQLKKSDRQIESFRVQCGQLKKQIDEGNQLISHLQQKLKQEQQETIEFKDKIIISEKMNETLEQTIEKLMSEISTAKEKSKKEFSLMITKYKKNEEDYLALKSKLEEIGKKIWGKYGTENLEIFQLIQTINEYFSQVEKENVEIKFKISQITEDLSKLTNENINLVNTLQQQKQIALEMESKIAINEQEQLELPKIDNTDLEGQKLEQEQIPEVIPDDNERVESQIEESQSNIQGEQIQ